MKKASDNEDKILDQIFHLAHDAFYKDGYEVYIVEILDPYLKKRPEHGQAWLLYGDSLRVIGRSSEAMPVLLKALEMAPEKEKSSIYGKIAFLCQKYRSPTEAEKWYDSATNCEIEAIDWLWMFKGANLAVLEKYEDSLKCFNKIISIKNSELTDEAYLNIGLVFRAMGKYEDSAEALGKALELNPDYEEAKLALDGLLALKNAKDLILD